MLCVWHVSVLPRKFALLLQLFISVNPADVIFQRAATTIPLTFYINTLVHSTQALYLQYRVFISTYLHCQDTASSI